MDASMLDKIASLFQSKTSIKSNSQTVALLDPLSTDEEGGVPVLLEGDDSLSTETGPMGTSADIEDYYPVNDQIETYTTKSGDTIKSIAKLFDVSPNTIVWANNITLDQKITEGQTFIILPVSGIKYMVKKGDTLASLAKRFGADVSDITSFNGISSLTVGESVIIPNGELSAPKPKSVAKKTTSSKEPRIVRKGDSVFDRTIGQIFSPGGPQAGDTVARSKHGEKIWGFNAPEYKGYYIFPVDGGIKTQDLHGFNGIDIGKGAGAPIKAAASGTIIVSKSSGFNGGYGKYLVIAHDNGTQTLYSHNSKNLVGIGDKIEQGQTIALMGRTGHATGNHVHFEVRGARNPFATSALVQNTSSD